MSLMRNSIRLGTALLLATAGATVLTGWQLNPSPVAHVLLVCNGSSAPCPSTATPPFQKIQAAVNAAKPGDWILIWPGVYHENNAAKHAGVWVGTGNLHIRGLDRNSVIIDGSNGTAANPCPSAPALQDFTPRNGIEVTADDVSVQNLTVCDYLGRDGEEGTQIWWNGGDETGQIGMGGYSGSYLSATATFHPVFRKGANPVSHFFAGYGIFVSNARGPGVITHSYASNMADTAFYIGACQQACHTTLSGDVATNSFMGYSGTNSGGQLIITHSVFFGNHSGIVANSQNADPPPPQNGRCPNTTRSCTLIEHNVVVDNNNPDVPSFGKFPVHSVGPAIGAGIELAGSQYDTVRDNLIRNQGSWGVVTHDYPDPLPPPPITHCQGGFPDVMFFGSKLCDYPARGNLIYGNTFVNDGFFGNPANGDLATMGLRGNSADPRNCFWANRAPRDGGLTGLTSSPAHIERPDVDGPACGRRGTSHNSELLTQLLCSGNGIATGCSGSRYPAQTKLVVVPLPRLASMPDPCAGVPANAFCARERHGSSRLG